MLIDTDLLNSIILSLSELDLLGGEGNSGLLGVLVEEEGDLIFDMLVYGRLVDIVGVMRDDCLGWCHVFLEELLVVLEGEGLLALFDEGKYADEFILCRPVLRELATFHPNNLLMNCRLTYATTNLALTYIKKEFLSLVSWIRLEIRSKERMGREDAITSSI